MKVSIKEFNVDMPVKNNGIEFEVRSSDGKTHLGDLLVTKAALTWCPGQTRPENGHKISWQDFIKLATKHGSGK